MPPPEYSLPTHSFWGLLSLPGLPANSPSPQPQLHWPIHSQCVPLALFHFFFLPFFLLVQSRWLLGLSLSPFFSVCAKWGLSTLTSPPVHPLHCGPSRPLLKVLSINHFFKERFFSRAARGHRSHQSCFPTQWPFNQAEVHFAAALFRTPFLPGAQGWSWWPRPFRIPFLPKLWRWSGWLTPIPRDLEVDWVPHIAPRLHLKHLCLPLTLTDTNLHQILCLTSVILKHWSPELVVSIYTDICDIIGAQSRSFNWPIQNTAALAW